MACCGKQRKEFKENLEKAKQSPTVTKNTLPPPPPNVSPERWARIQARQEKIKRRAARIAARQKRIELRALRKSNNI